MADVLAWEAKNQTRTYQRRGDSAAQFADAVGRFVGDLLRAHHLHETPSARRLYHSLARKSFTGGPVTYTNFEPAMSALVGLGLVGHREGKRRFTTGFGGSVSLPGTAADFGATARLLRLAKGAGVSGDIQDHFGLEPPRDVLRLMKASSNVHGVKVRGGPEPFSATKRTERLAQQVRDLNAFLSRFDIRGGHHWGYVRQFERGDVPGFGWQWGGRLYSIGAGNYQQQPQEARARMTINGEPVVEVDIQAANLTILHALLRAPFDTSTDPYARAGALPRDLVKLWTNASIGAGEALARWPQNASDDYAKEHGGTRPSKVARAAEVRARMLAAFPALKRLGERSAPGWADLMFRESEAVLGAMLELMARDIPSLSVFDSLIVPSRHAAEGAGVLSGSFRKVVGVTPGLSTKSNLKGAKAAVGASTL